MKFGSYLKSHRVTEWRNSYIDYRTLKKLIKRAAPENNQEQTEDVADDSDREDATPVVSPSSQAFPSPAGGRRESAVLESPTSENRDIRHSLETQSAKDLGDIDNLSVGAPTTARSTAFLRQRSSSSRSNASRRRTGRTTSRGGIRTLSSSFRRSGGLRFPQSTPLERIIPHLNENERKLFSVFDRELDKVNSFYCEREARAVTRIRQIEDQLEELERHRKANEEYKATHHTYVPETLRDLGHSVGDTLPHAVTDRIKRVVSHVDGTQKPAEINGKTAIPPETGAMRPTVTQDLHHWRPETYARARRTLKEAIFEEYRYLGMLKSYRSLNRQGFSKALKKAEKVTKIPCSQTFMGKVNSSRFVSSTGLDELTGKAEQMFAEHFEGGSRKKALERLRLLGVKKTHHGAAGRAGTWIGLAIPALVSGIVKSFDADFRARTPEWPALMQLFGALLLPVSLACSIQLNLTVWHRSRINFPLIFELDLRTMIDWHQYLELPAFLFCLLCYAFWLSMSNFWPTKLSPDVWPLVWVVTTLVILVNPLPMFNLRARYWLLKKIARSFTFGVLPVGFTDFWLGDQLTSLYYLFYNFGFLVCTYHRDFNDVPPQCNTNDTWGSPVLASIPAMIRLGQSIRRYVDSDGMAVHAFNAGKYSFNVIYFWVYFNWRINGSEWDGRVVAFIIIGIINSSYSTIWDLALDWGLLQRRSRYAYLRPELVYKHAIWSYPMAMVVDTLLRFSWVIYLAPQPSVQLRGWMVGFIETLRRFVWNFYRLESEQIGNADAYRVTRDVPLPFSLTPKEEESREHEESAPSSAGLSTWALHPVTQISRALKSDETDGKKRTVLDKVTGRMTSESSDQDATGSDYGNMSDREEV